MYTPRESVNNDSTRLATKSVIILAVLVVVVIVGWSGTNPWTMSSGSLARRSQSVEKNTRYAMDLKWQPLERSDRRVMNDVYGGNSVSAHEYQNRFNFIVMIKIYKGQNVDPDICGGTLVNTFWVLTARHCFDGQVTSATVHYGAPNPQSSWAAALTANRLPKVEYPNNNNIDVALLKVHHDGNLRNAGMKLANINPQNLRGGYQLKVFGWGWTRRNVFPNTLQMGVMGGFMAQCPDNQLDNPQARCIRRLNNGNGAVTMDGDSGGPVMYWTNNNRNPIVVGVISGGNSAGVNPPANAVNTATECTTMGQIRQWVTNTAV